ncbi:uncharacterized protein LOC143891144 [Tasmannia lanceolata]|uniref:uncharacterized protein LOC143891144 n=1 Tax=Tasmannia lanceolata TaxID=3420 RepID=UPI0040630874
MCRREEESLDHLFITCPYAFRLWMAIFRAFGVSSVMYYSVSTVISHWRGMFNGCLGRLLWLATPYAILWHIWNERNCRILNGKEKTWRHILLDVKLSIIAWARRNGGIPYPVGMILRHWDTVAKEMKISPDISPRWDPPPAGWFKLNFDGSSFGNPGRLALGESFGILRAIPS